MGSDPLVGLAINPGACDIMLPSADELRSLGVQWIRFLPYHSTQNVDSGHNSELDRVVECARAAGAQILVLINPETIDELPPLGKPDDLGDANSGYIGRVADLAQKIAGRYRGQIGAIEVFNEPEVQGMAPEEYAALLAGVYQKVKQVTDAPVISAGIARGQNFDYLQKVIQIAPGACDGVGWHPYAQRIESFPASDWGYGDFIDSLMRARAIGGKPLWLTEFGTPRDHAWPSGMSPAEGQAEYVKRSFTLFRELGRDMVAHAFWFTWKDLVAGWGLTDKSGNHLAAWSAFQQAANAGLPAITQVGVTPSLVGVGEVVNVNVTVTNNSLETLATQGPNPGYVYLEGETFYSTGFPDVRGAFRVGVDFDGRTGVDHPYRWGLGTPLAPGETRVINGAIRMRTQQSKNYWAGLVKERVAWLQSRAGSQLVTVNPGIQMTNVTFAPASLNAGQVLSISVTVINKGTTALPTQGPVPGFIYDEGDTFVSEGFLDETGKIRIGVDFQGRAGMDHPYRWGLGSPLAPGESRLITGGIRLKKAATRKYWAGLVEEHVAWLQDVLGAQTVTSTLAPAGNPPTITDVKLVPAALNPGQLLLATITVRNDSNATIETQGPDPEFVYDEGDTFSTRGFADVRGANRIGIDFEGRKGIDHPYRWGLGSALAPGETRVITGSIRLKTAKTAKYWAGLVQEQVKWLLDKQGTTNVTVATPPVQPPRITAVSISPTELAAGELLNVSITVKNESNDTLTTQNPAPDFVYDEGDTIYTRGYSEVRGAYRVGIDFEARTGIDHPYRWGLGSPLAAGETRVITGAIRMKSAQTREYWAGLVREHVAWVSDRQGVQGVNVALAPDVKPRVVHVHDLAATTWTGQSDYWNYVSQDTVTAMVERGIVELTRCATPVAAWRQLLPRYQAGRGIAVKVNFANGGSGQMDAVVQTLNAVIAGLKTIGVNESDIWVFEAAQKIPDRFVQGCPYGGVRFFDNGAHEAATFESTDANAHIQWTTPPAGVAAQPHIRISDLIVNATYVINLPILKGHVGGAGVTFAFKNHFGSTNNPSGIHPYVFLDDASFRLDYSALVDLYLNPHIRNKTAVIIADGLFSGNHFAASPMTFATFENKTPSSLFFATDPVAVDSIMYDLLEAEWHISSDASNYLRLAEAAGLGVYERGDPWGAGYQKIEYQKIEM